VWIDALRTSALKAASVDVPSLFDVPRRADIDGACHPVTHCIDAGNHGTYYARIMIA
jgi:hypothetical protein